MTPSDATPKTPEPRTVTTADIDRLVTISLALDRRRTPDMDEARFLLGTIDRLDRSERRLAEAAREARAATRTALVEAWNDGHRAGIGCGHDLAVCRHNDIEAEIDDLASWNELVAASIEDPSDDR